MHLQDTQTMTTPPQVGEWYLVPTAETDRHDAPVPLVASAWHADVDLFGLAIPAHAHVDLRFFAGDMSLFKDGFTIVIERHAIGGIQLRPLQCLSEWPEQPADPRSGWFSLLEVEMAEARAECLRCPHQNQPMGHMPPSADGSRVCPAHGLRWGSEGELVPQSEIGKLAQHRLQLAARFSQLKTRLNKATPGTDEFGLLLNIFELVKDEVTALPAKMQVLTQGISAESASQENR